MGLDITNSVTSFSKVGSTSREDVLREGVSREGVSREGASKAKTLKPNPSNKSNGKQTSFLKRAGFALAVGSSILGGAGGAAALPGSMRNPVSGRNQIDGRKLAVTQDTICVPKNLGAVVDAIKDVAESEAGTFTIDPAQVKQAIESEPSVKRATVSRTGDEANNLTVILNHKDGSADTYIMESSGANTEVQFTSKNSVLLKGLGLESSDNSAESGSGCIDNSIDGVVSALRSLTQGEESVLSAEASELQQAIEEELGEDAGVTVNRVDDSSFYVLINNEGIRDFVLITAEGGDTKLGFTTTGSDIIEGFSLVGGITPLTSAPTPVPTPNPTSEPPAGQSSSGQSSSGQSSSGPSANSSNKPTQESTAKPTDGPSSSASLPASTRLVAGLTALSTASMLLARR